MTLDIQIKLKSNPYYIRYIREHSNWYKILNRDPMMFKDFEEKVKEDYKLRPMDKVAKALDTIELLQNILTTLK